MNLRVRFGSLLCLALSSAMVAAGDSKGRLEVSPSEAQLFIHGGRQLLVTRRGTRTTDVTSIASYESSNSEVVRVSSSGWLTALRAGKAAVSIRQEGQSKSISVVVSKDFPPVSFVRDIVPILTKRGCNSGGCHGKATGQNGFKISLLGFDAELDYRAIVKQARGRRIFYSAPRLSLLLRKAVGLIPHGGGQRLDIDSHDYRLLETWIRQGAVGPLAAEAKLTRITVQPSHRVLRQRAGKTVSAARQQLVVTAHFSDGGRHDVTRRSVFQSNEPTIGQVTPTGLVKTQTASGLFAVMVRFGGQIATFHAAVPFQSSGKIETALGELESKVGKSKFDRYLFQQWRELGLKPSQVADDWTFIRRVMIDVCGTLPTAREAQAFAADRRPDKHRQLIDRLLRRPEYASYFALKWAGVLQNRGRGYSTSKQRAGTALFAGWLRASIAANKPYQEFVAEIITATGSQITNPPTVWHRSVRTLPNYVESVAQAFLGVRIQCAQCHHHPFDRWSQADYYGLAAVFSRVGRKGGFADAEVPTNETIYLKAKGEVLHPRTGKRILPRALGGPAFRLDRYDDPRLHLARWMTKPQNEFFARTMVNRMWAHFMGRGIIQPIDDARSTNPPTNPALLNALTRDFIASGYDVKHLIRAICGTYAYRLSAVPNDNNRADSQSFARFYPRRIIAEVLLDGMSQVLDVPTEFSGGSGKFPIGTRAIDLPDENVPAHFLDVFGRPARTSACECERGDAPSLAQALELVNSTEIQRKLMASGGLAARMSVNGASHQDNVDAIFVRVFARRPTDQERQTAIKFLKSEKNRGEAYRSLLWSLLATNEFLFNH